MAVGSNKEALKNVRERNYLARDFDGFRAVLLEYARQYYPEKIQDFSESSLGGLLLDMAAYVGDNMSFYLDHLFNELHHDTAVETVNIQQAITNAGIKITGAAPSTVTVDFYIEVPVISETDLRPNPDLLPTILANSTVRSDTGIIFTLIDDIRFWSKNDSTNDISVNVAKVTEINGRKIGNKIVSKILKASGLCSSGEQAIESFAIGSFIPYRKITLSYPDVTSVVSVSDGFNNTYYEVDSLSNDVVYKNVINTSSDSTLVPNILKLIPAPYRYTTETSLSNRLLTMTMGGGTADSLEDDVIPDPANFAIAFPFSKTFSRISINPQKMLQTNTLGVCASNTDLTIIYRHGGGLNHNVNAKTIRNAEGVTMRFPQNPQPGLQAQVRRSVEVLNPETATGGEDPPATDQLVQLIPTMKNSQERVVTREDLLARVYTMPSNFGRVFRASVVKNPNNPLATKLIVISRDTRNNLITSPDSLKVNLKKYLSSYRMISDAVDIFDANIINLELNFKIVVDPGINKTAILQDILVDLKNQFNIKNFHIGQPIVISDVINTIYSKKGVIAVDKLQFKNLTNTIAGRKYSDKFFAVNGNTKNQIIYPPDDCIFEIKYPDVNIIGKVVSNV